MMQTRSFGKLHSGQMAQLFVLENRNHMQVGITNFGGAVVFIKVPDWQGEPLDVVLGYDDVQGYETRDTNFGVLVGRYANRIQGGEFSLDGKTYILEKNEGQNHLHGGSQGFGHKLWDYEILSDGVLKLTLMSPDGEGGYPGNVTATVTYALDDENCLSIDYLVTTDQETICNMTNHSYFNLNGQSSGTILNHILEIDADAITAIDEEGIPTGEILSVGNTPFDFRQPKPIGRDMWTPHPQLEHTRGYDHNFVLNEKGAYMAKAKGEKSNLVMEMETTCPGVQLYVGNYLNHELGKEGIVYPTYGGFCLETQLFPDSIHHRSFPSCVIDKDHPWKHSTKYRFYLEEKV